MSDFGFVVLEFCFRVFGFRAVRIHRSCGLGVRFPVSGCLHRAMANKSVADRLGGVEAALHNVQQLANTTAKGVGKDRAQRQEVCFCQGGFRAAVEEALQRWQDGAKEVKAEGSASASADAPANRPLPFNFSFILSWWDSWKNKAWTLRSAVDLKNSVWKRLSKPCSLRSLRRRSAKVTYMDLKERSRLHERLLSEYVPRRSFHL